MVFAGLCLVPTYPRGMDSPGNAWKRGLLINLEGDSASIELCDFAPHSCRNSN